MNPDPENFMSVDPDEDRKIQDEELCLKECVSYPLIRRWNRLQVFFHSATVTDP
jgi:hypothetical protein